jgi:molybdate transport system substrate-binding protein
VATHEVDLTLDQPDAPSKPAAVNILIVFFCLSLTPASGLGANDKLTIAVAANFKNTLEILVADFQSTNNSDIRVSSASTGILYAQIESGAPFDVFLAADVFSPKSLVENQLGLATSRFTYALGQLVVWIPHHKNVNRDSLLSVVGKVSIANPQTAPYGIAARQLLQSLGLWRTMESHLVYGSNVAQAFQYVVSGNTKAGIVAWPLLNEYQGKRELSTTDSWIVPSQLHTPIQQQAIQLTKSKNAVLAQRFLKFLKSDRSRAIIKQHGYLLPLKTGET